MNSRIKFIVSAIFLILILVISCSPEVREAAQDQESLAAADVTAAPALPSATQPPTHTPRPSDTPEPTETRKPTITPWPSKTPRPTWTMVPTNTPGPTKTPGPPVAFEVSPNLIGPDSCPMVFLDPDLWSPIQASFVPVGGQDERYQFIAEEDEFAFSVRMYTHGGPWNERLGTFQVTCTETAGNFCIIMQVGENDNVFLATSGEIEIVSLARIEDELSGPVEFTLSNLSMHPHHAFPLAQGCYHLDEITLKVDEP